LYLFIPLSSLYQKRKNMNYSTEILEKAQRLSSAKGAVMTFEAVCEMLAKSEAKQAKKFGSKKEAKKYEQRQMVEAMPKVENANTWLAEKNRENAMKNLPSSLR
jgi:hypothetical protein